VVAPVDFSDDSRTSAALALALTDPGGVLTIVHVDPLPDPSALAAMSGGELPHALHTLGEHQRARFSAQLEQLVGEMLVRAGGAARPEVRGLSRSGEAVDGITGVAREVDAELIVMGAHGESGSVRFLFGSVTGKVTRQAPCPVLVTRPGRSEQIAAKGSFHRALVAVDYSPFSRPAARLARGFLAPGGTLTLLHVWQSPGNLPLPFTGDRQNVAIDRLHEFARELEGPGVDIEPVVDVGNPASQVLAQARRMGADLVVVGAHGRSSMVEKILGTVADRVLRHADAPVLLLPEAAADVETPAS